MKDNVTVLIVDEYDDVREALAEQLDAAPGIRVLAHTSNPFLGAELAHELEPRVILADFKRRAAPRADLYQWILQASPKSKLLVLTSYMGIEEEARCMQAGASRILLKGISAKRLAAEIKTLASVNGSHPGIAGAR